MHLHHVHTDMDLLGDRLVVLALGHEADNRLIAIRGPREPLAQPSPVSWACAALNPRQ